MHMQFTSTVAYSDLAEVCLFSRLSVSSSVFHVHTVEESRVANSRVADSKGADSKGAENKRSSRVDVQTSSENNPHKFPCF
jgi:hypothetical protein